MDPLANPEAMIDTVARICEREQQTSVVEVLRNCTASVEQTDYHEDWGRQTYTFAIHLQISPEQYANISAQITSTERLILKHARALIRHTPENVISAVFIVPNVVERAGAQGSAYRVSSADLIGQIELQRSLMIAVATGGPRIQQVNSEYQSRRERIREGLAERRIEDPNLFDDLWSWYGKWSGGDLPTYQSRRRFISDLYGPLITQIRTQDATQSPGRVTEPTGWAKVDRALHEARRRLATAESEEQFQAVGLICREALISLAQMVFDPALHPTLDSVPASETDAKRMLEAYIAKTLSGGANEIPRRHARAALDLANNLQHQRTAGFRQAALCAEATTSVVNLLAIMSGRRDPQQGGP